MTGYTSIPAQYVAETAVRRVNVKLKSNQNSNYVSRAKHHVVVLFLNQNKQNLW